jgi:3-hydroxyisobutyrate dehydrogenase
MSKLRIAFLGLGLMGSGMARRLLTAGFPLTVYNRNPDKTLSFAHEGARVAASPCDAAAQAEVIISMVADDNAARAVWLGQNGALASAAPGTVCIECSTVSVHWVRELATSALTRHCEFIDAPVTGSKSHAASGELNFLIGGSEVTLEKVRTVLEVMSKTITPLGPIGSGALLKLINNFVCGVQVASLAEAVTMIERSGLDRTKALDILTNGAPGSPLVKTVAGRMMLAEFKPHFLLRLMAKDLEYAIHEGRKISVELTTALAALAAFQKGILEGHGEKDIAALIELSRKHLEIPQTTSVK